MCVPGIVGPEFCFHYRIQSQGMSTATKSHARGSDTRENVNYEEHMVRDRQVL